MPRALRLASIVHASSTRVPRLPRTPDLCSRQSGQECRPAKLHIDSFIERVGYGDGLPRLIALSEDRSRQTQDATQAEHNDKVSQRKMADSHSKAPKFTRNFEFARERRPPGR